MSDGTAVERITRTIYSYANLTLKLNVKLYNKDVPLHAEYEVGGKTYIRLDQFAYLTLEIATNPGETWNPSKGIMITPIHVYDVIKTFKTVMKDIQEQDIYMVKKNDDIVIDKEKAQLYTAISNIPSCGSIKVMPTIVYDQNDISYEGVNIFINDDNNVSSIPISYFEALVCTMEKIDIFQYSQMLMNYYISAHPEYVKLTHINVSKPKVNRTIFEDTSGNSDGETVSNFKRVVPSNETDNLFNGLNTK